MALPKTLITGKVLLPDGTAPASGSITAKLVPVYGSATDDAAFDAVATEITVALEPGGALPAGFGLVPNDAMTPAGTYYRVDIRLLGRTGIVHATPTEKWQVPTSATPVSIGAVPRLGLVPGLAVQLALVVPDAVVTEAAGQVTALMQPLVDAADGSADAASASEAAAQASAAAAAASEGEAAASETAAAGSESNAAASAQAAASSATAAGTAKTGAEAARDAALASAMYPDTTGGLAATAEGGYFWTPGTGATAAILYRKEAGAAVQRGSIPSSSGVLDVAAATAISSGLALRRLWGNLFDPAASVTGAITRTTGVFNEGASSNFVSAFIPVTPGGTITTSAFNTGSANYGITFYDKAQTYLAGTSVAGPFLAGQVVNVPATACWMRLTALLSVRSGVVLLAGTQAAPGVIATHTPARLADVEDAAGRLHDDAARPAWANLHDPLAIASGGNINVSTGAWVANASYFATDFLPVVPGGTFTTSPALPIATPYGISYYDATRTLIAGSGVVGPFTDGQVHTVPAGAHYARLSMQLGYNTTLVVLPGTQTPGHVSTHAVAKVSNTSAWAGKSLGVQGDSISISRPGASPGGWIAFVAAQVHASVGLNAAVGGRKMARALYASDDVTPLGAPDVAGLDGLFLFLGTNDFGNATPLGTIADAPNIAGATFYAQLRAACETFIGWKQTLRLILVTPLYRGNATTPNAAGLVLADYAAAIRNVAALYALPVLDLERVSGASPLTVATFFDDALHPNATGFATAVFPPARGLLSSVLPAQ